MPVLHVLHPPQLHLLPCGATSEASSPLDPRVVVAGQGPYEGAAATCVTLAQGGGLSFLCKCVWLGWALPGHSTTWQKPYDRDP